MGSHGAQIGLSGHKNTFSNGVRVGNWVEELMSGEVPQKVQKDSTARYFETTSKDSYQAPEKSVLLAGREMTTKHPSASHVDRPLLFGHGQDLSATRFTTLNSLTFVNPRQNTSSALKPHDTYEKDFPRSQNAMFLPREAAESATNVKARYTTTSTATFTEANAIGKNGVTREAAHIRPRTLTYDLDEDYHNLGLRTGVLAYRTALVDGEPQWV